MENITLLLKKEYLQAIFYFMLKKTSNHYEAEDLSQEVIYEVLNSLNHGTVPNDFNAWVWQIARNRYARWSERKTRNYYVPIPDEISDNVDVSDNLIRSEELTELRRELQLLHSDYRKIVAEYYFKNRKISDIAEMVSLPVGTVKRKLHECRQYLKEGMKMSRTYGTRSFNPDDVRFYLLALATDKDVYRHNRYVEKMLSKNILLEAYDNPSSAEDLSLALGIALPYMEEEIKILHDVELLIKDEDNRYLTNCTIISKESQIDVDNKLTEIIEKFNPLLIETIESLKDEKIFGGYQSFENMKLSLIVMLIRYMCENSPSNATACVKTTRPDGSKWDLFGFEKVDRKYKGICVYEMGDYIRIKMVGRSMLDSAEHMLDMENEKVTLRNVVNDSVADTDIPYLDKLCERNVVKKTADNKYLPLFAIVTDYEKEHLLELAKKSHFDELAKLKYEYISFANQRYKKDIPSYLANKTWDNEVNLFEACAVEYAVNIGYMARPTDSMNSAVGLIILN
jgi:RNA polymerase sigma factor, sigma-70 family